MGSPSARFSSGKYTGDGVDASYFSFSPGWQPKKIVVRSAEGEASWHEGATGWYVRAEGGVGAFIAEAPELLENGVKWKSADDALNKVSVAYQVELQG